MRQLKIILRFTFPVFIGFLLTACTVKTPGVNIIPAPESVAMQKGVFSLSEKCMIYFDRDCKYEALYLQQLLENEYQLSVQTMEAVSSSVPKGIIYLSLKSPETGKLSEEAYSMLVDKKNITIYGSTSAGVFYGIQSLRQIIDLQSDKLIIPCVKINDQPRFAWRAFMLDEGRYFKGMEVVKNLLDEMAVLKMNTFHWHLTDDQGWRIEITKYPELTRTGATRKMTETGTWLSNVFDSTEHSGHYTQQEIKEIIEYASERHITIIPEIEMPGHASAAIASYPWLSTTRKQIEVPIRFGIQQNVYNVTDPRVIQFIHDVLDEIMVLFPSQIVHIGGDEVKYDQWKASGEVSAYMKRNNIHSFAGLQISFTNNISNYLQQNGHRMMGWNEILGGTHGDEGDADNNQKLSPNVIIHFWTGDPQIVNTAAEKGYDVVNSFYEFTYLDYDYKTTSLAKAYGFDPVPATLHDSLQSRIMGLGCQMWGEWIPNVERMNFQIFPRIAAFAETGWTQKGGKDYNAFIDKLKTGYLAEHWQKKGITLTPEQME